MTIKEIRKTMRALNKDGRTVSEKILIPGYGQIQKIGKSYAVGPLPENDDSDPLTDYSAGFTVGKSHGYWMTSKEYYTLHNSGKSRFNVARAGHKPGSKIQSGADNKMEGRT